MKDDRTAEASRLYVVEEYLFLENKRAMVADAGEDEVDEFRLDKDDGFIIDNLVLEASWNCNPLLRINERKQKTNRLGTHQRNWL